MTNEFNDLIEEMRKKAELELSKRPLHERAVFLVFFPLAVNLVTDRGSASLTINKNCSINVRGLSQNPDNTVRTTFEVLRSLYYSLDKERFRQAERNNEIRIESHTFKGKQAEKKLREILGG